MKDNEPSTDPESPSHWFDEIDAPEPYNLTLEEGEMMLDPDESPFEESIPDTRGPVFDSQRFLRNLSASQFSANKDLSDSWSYQADYLLKRFGLVEVSEQIDYGKSENFPAGLGLCKGPTDLSVAALYDSVVHSDKLPHECDLSPSFAPCDDGFPYRSPNSVLGVICAADGYLATVNDGVPRPWKLFIKDPLTVLQIEREKWHLDREGLVSNLIRKGIPFRIFYTYSKKDAAFHPHPGPIVHPQGKPPTYADYMAYCLDVADFFKRYPHAHAAALCAGGILWRIATDTLPLPAEHQIVRPFDRRACDEYMVDGEHYWSPKLTDEEEEEVVGVYRWARKSS
jgi:hypothetical protein